MAAMSPLSSPLFSKASASAPNCEERISIGSCSTQPGRGYICGNGCCAIETISPRSLKMIARELVVPWSRAMMLPFIPASSASLTLSRF